jgi:DNA-binding MarR family transcriptional regulator
MVATLPALMQSIVSEMRRGGVPMPMPHFRALHVLVHHPQKMSDLAECTHVSLPTMSNTVSVLVERGWAERVADPTDRRKAEVRVTAQGREALHATEKRVLGLLENRLGTMRDADIETLIVALDVLARNFGTMSHGDVRGEAESA